MPSLGQEVLIKETTKELVWEKISQLIKEKDVMLFVKGDALIPQCGFSARAMQVMNLCQVSYHTADVLKNSTLREVIKEYSDWPTIPQCYVKGEFIGGADILTELYQSGELQEKLKVVQHSH